MNAWCNVFFSVFSNGWAPELTDDSRDRSSVLASEVATEVKRTRGEDIRSAQHEVGLNLN